MLRTPRIAETQEGYIVVAGRARQPVGRAAVSPHHTFEGQRRYCICCTPVGENASQLDGRAGRVTRTLLLHWANFNVRTEIG